MIDDDRPYRRSSPRRRTVHTNEEAKKSSVLITQMVVGILALLLVYGIKLAAPNEFQSLKYQYTEIMKDNKTYEKVEEAFNSLIKGGKLEGKITGTAGEGSTERNEEDESFDADLDTPSTITISAPEEVLPTAVPLAGNFPVSLSLTEDFATPPPSTCTYAPFKLNIPITVPVEGEVTSSFGYRVDPFNGEKTFHKGMDIAAAKGTKIKAAFQGMVISSGTDQSLGKYVQIQHDNDLATVYAHCSKLLVQVGDLVKAGDEIAEVGSTGRSTGPHLHFEIRIAGIRYDPAYVLN